MQGSVSISMEQLLTLERTLNETSDVVTVVFHPSLLRSGAVRVGLHRAHANTVWFGIERDGKRIPSERAA